MFILKSRRKNFWIQIGTGFSDHDCIYHNGKSIKIWGFSK